MAVKVTYDFNGLSPRRVGEGGVCLSELEALSGRLKNAHKAAMRMRRRGVVGFWDLPHDSTIVRQINSLARTLKGYDNFVVFGVGGSISGNVALHDALCHPCHNDLSRKRRGNSPRIYFVGNQDAVRLAGLMEVLDLKRTAFNVVSKSGDSVEPLSAFLYVYGQLEKRFGKRKPSRHLVLTTDERKGALREIANALGCPTLPVPDNVASRFSVFTAAGLLSAAVAGVNIGRVLSGAAIMDRRCRSMDWRRNPALAGAAFQYLAHMRKKRGLQVLIPCTAPLRGIADWYCQVHLESLSKAYDRQGKKVNVGQAAVKTGGMEDLYAQMQMALEGPDDKIATLLMVDKQGSPLAVPRAFPKSEAAAYLGGKDLREIAGMQAKAVESVLQRSMRPSCSLRIGKLDEAHVGALIFLLQAQTAYLAELHDINAYDQPGADKGRHYAFGLLGRRGYEEYRQKAGELPEPEAGFIF